MRGKSLLELLIGYIFKTVGNTFRFITYPIAKFFSMLVGFIQFLFESTNVYFIMAFILILLVFIAWVMPSE